MKKIKCAEIEELLIKKSFENLADSEKNVLKEHLKLCDQCRIFEKTLMKIHGSLELAGENVLIPNPAIWDSLVNRIKATKREQAGLLNKVWQSFVASFKIKIPVYKVVLGIVAVFLIFYSLESLNFFGREKNSTLLKPFQTEKLGLDSTTVLEYINLIEKQKIGRSIRDDSLLISFIVTLDEGN